MPAYSLKAKIVFSCLFDRYLVPFILALFILSAFLIPAARAQEEGQVIIEFENTGAGTDAAVITSNVTSTGDSAIPETLIRDEAPPPEVLEDFTITISDLDAYETEVLPDSAFHFLKRFGWGLQEAFTFDPVADAELKLQHSNQQLAEIKLLIDRVGLENIDPEVLQNALRHYEERFAKVSQTTDALKEAREGDTNIEEVLNEVTEKQFKQQEFLDFIAKTLLEKTQEFDTSPEFKGELEALYARVFDTKTRALEDFSEFIVDVDVAPEATASRIENVLAREEGSEFNGLKHLEFLDAVHDKVPENAREAIKRAKQNTIVRFETKIQALPPVVRAEKFKDYIRHATADETRLMGLLEEIKQSSGIPADLLSIIEEAKEIVVNRFEEKLTQIDNRELKDRFFRHFDPENVQDLIVLEEFRNRIKGGIEIAALDDAHERSIAEFKARFTDVDSQAEAVLFQQLSEEMLHNPSPKTFKLLEELEAEVRNDPEKRAFLDDIERRMIGEMETRYRTEGDRFMDRMATLDPSDLGFFENFEFDQQFESRFVDHNADRFKDYMQDINHPEDFDRFHERFFDVPDFVINEINQYDNSFQAAMQFKVRKMEEVRAEQELEIRRASLDYEERELYHQIDRVQQQENDAFWNELNEIPWEDFNRREDVWEVRIQDQYQLADDRYTEQIRIFKERIALDPWCDTVCQQIQLQYLEQDLRHEKERLADELIRERNRIEIEQSQFEQDNPLANICDTPESCEQYCRNNQGSHGCEWYFSEPIDFHGDCPFPSYWDFGTGSCIYPDYEVPVVDCTPGYYWDFGVNNCVVDPYYHAPTDFQDCGYGAYWNPTFGFCEKEDVYYPPVPVCHSEAYWDEGAGRCVDYVRECGFGYYFDYYEDRCQEDKASYCGDEEYWDYGLNRCISHTVYNCPVFDILPCENGQRREDMTGADGCWYPGECVPYDTPPPINCPEVYPEPCPPGEYREYIQGGDGCWFPDICIQSVEDNWKEYVWSFSDGSETSYILNRTDQEYLDYIKGIAISCSKISKKEFYWPKGAGDDSNWKVFGIPECFVDGTTPTPDPVPPILVDDYCGDGTCNEGETEFSCSIDCKVSCVPSSLNNFTATPYNCSNSCAFGCNYDMNGCVESCMTGKQMCENISGDWRYNTTTGSCVKAGVACGSTTACSACPLGTLNSVCDYDFNGCPLGCTSTAAYCGDNICNTGETVYSCSQDCGSPTYCSPTLYNDYKETDICSNTHCDGFCNYDSTGCPVSCSIYTEETCGNGYCGSGETDINCPADCKVTDECKTTPYYCVTESSCNESGYFWCNAQCYGTTESCGGTTTPYCGNNICESGETSSSCSTDCSTGAPYCGDGYCDPDESSTSCYSDCGSGTTSCTPNQYNDYTENSSCSYSACSNGCTYENNSGCPVGCYDPNFQCTQNSYNDNQTYTYSCSWSACSWGCNYDSNGCAFECASAAGSCGSGWYYDSVSGACVREGVTCSNPNACSACPHNTDPAAYSSSWCTWDNDGCPTGCQDSSTAGYCGNGICDSGEDSSWCSSDCGGSSTSYYCGDGLCNNGETTSSCVSDCGSTGNSSGTYTCPATEYNDNNVGSFMCSYVVCTNGCNYDSYGCATGCYAGTGTGGGYCGNNYCESNESSTSCPADCGGTGSCPATEGNNYTSDNYCSSSCTSGCNYDNGCPTSCWSSSTSGGYCGDTVCMDGETQTSCPSDCGAATTCPSTAYNDYTTGNYCNYTQCSNGCNYDSSGCPTSCWETGGCGDTICNNGETSASCPADCGAVSGVKIETGGSLLDLWGDFFKGLFGG